MPTLMNRLPRPTSPALCMTWAWAGLLFGGMVAQFTYHPWAFVDAPYELYLAKSLNIKEMVIHGFTEDVVYRPLNRVGIDLLYGVVGANLIVFKALTVILFAGVLWCFVALFRVATRYQALAACLALSCFVGLHTSTVMFGFFPVSFHSVALLGLLATAVLCMRAHRSWYPAYFFAVCLVIPFVIESGLLLLPMMVSLWWAGAPGVQRRDVAWGVGGVALYLTVRMTLSRAGADVPWIYTESGFGFGQIDPEGFSDTFGRMPYLFWLYNVMANLMTVLFSEPRGGTFEFIRSMIAGDTPPWRWIHLATSLATTTSAAVVMLTRQRIEGRQRQLLVLGCTLLLSSSLLGFLYARDRVGLVTGAGYAVLVFLMASSLVESGRYRRVGSVALVVALLFGWTWRSAESMLVVRDSAFESYSDWILRYDPERPGDVPDPTLLATLHAASIASPPPNPRCAPEWTKRYFQRFLSDLITDCRNPVIHVRWIENLTDAQRSTLERTLGLYGARHSEGSTWRYRVSDVSPDRIDALAVHGMVADTYGFHLTADARFGPVIHVRWVDTLEEARRTMLERALGLYRPEHAEGTTWRYRVPDASPDRLRAIVAHDMVADTNGFDRGSLELNAPEGDVARLAAQPPVYTAGWHPPESDASAPESTWRWTQRTATLSFANPNADAALYLDFAARPDVFVDGRQTVTVSIGDRVLQSFAADSTGRRLHPIPLPTAALGTGDRVEIRIAVDRTFVPAAQPAGGGDERDLGIQVYHAFVVLR